MSKREKIILVAMAVAVLYGAYTFFFASAKKTGKAGKVKSLDEINRFVADVAVKLEDKNIQKRAYVLSQAKTDWADDPFFVIKAPVAAAKGEVVVETAGRTAVKKETFSYTGYLKMGNLAIAIIDGIEYEQGDELAKGGYIVKMIDPNRVLIGPQDENDNMVLFLNETK